MRVFFGKVSDLKLACKKNTLLLQGVKVVLWGSGASHRAWALGKKEGVEI